MCISLFQSLGCPGIEYLWKNAWLCSIALFTHGSNGCSPAFCALKNTHLRYSAKFPWTCSQCCTRSSLHLNPRWQSSQTTGGVAIACPAASVMASSLGGAAPNISPWMAMCKVCNGMQTLEVLNLFDWNVSGFRKKHCVPSRHSITGGFHEENIYIYIYMATALN